MASRTKEQIEAGIESLLAGDAPQRNFGESPNTKVSEATGPAVEVKVQDPVRPARKVSAIELTDDEAAFLCTWPNGMTYVLKCHERYTDSRTGRTVVMPALEVVMPAYQWKIFNLKKDAEVVEGLRKQGDYNTGLLMEAGIHLPKSLKTSPAPKE